MVTVADRDNSVALASAVTVIRASVVPVEGETLSQVASSVMVHVVSEAVILNVPVALATAVNETVVGVTERICPCSFARAENNIKAMARNFLIV
jgi:hypothetical protein